MTVDPFSFDDDLGGALEFALDGGPAQPALDFDIAIATELEEVEVRDVAGRLIGVIDLS